MDANQLQAAAEAALDAMRAAGFDQAQVTTGVLDLSELNANDNVPSMLRSTETTRCTLLGIVDGRMASTELAELSAEAVRQRALALFDDARAAPQDAANAVSSAQSLRLVQGPQQADPEALVAAVGEMLDFRSATTPRTALREGYCSHRLSRWHMLTSGGSSLQGSVGWYQLMAMCVAREGGRASSFNYAVGNTHDVRSAPAPAQFGLGSMMRDLERQIDTRPLGAKFTGEVVFAPHAVDALLGWLLGQVGDLQLVAGSSLYRDRVGSAIASGLLTVRSWFDAPGIAAASADAFAAPPVTLVERGVLRTLTPTLYGSRKTGLPHVPVAEGWDVAAGDTPLPELVGGVARGALVNRLSMGNPAANGDFSAVIKNSFAITQGEVGHALSETMISGNVAQLLRDIVAVSRETEDGDGVRRPWLRVRNLHFS